MSVFTPDTFHIIQYLVSPHTEQCRAVPSCCLQIRLDTGEFLLRGNNSRAEEVGSRLMCYTATSHCGTLGACTVECLRLGPAPTLCLVCILPFLSIFTWGSLQIPKYNVKLLFLLCESIKQKDPALFYYVILSGLSSL